jgi:hypothetical protein
MKSKVMVGLILSVEDNLVNTVVEFTNPALAGVKASASVKRCITNQLVVATVA